MRVRIRTISGCEYESDDVKRVEVERVLAKQGGTFDEYVEDIEAKLKDFDALDNIRIEYNGRNRHFNPANIEWVEVITTDALPF